ncbi:MAG: hypothetical protein P4L55_20980 [Syntrophobacteraceae bacterium]|nr:hypothetical protein [Syntrophobacteraceae bacterium]
MKIFSKTTAAEGSRKDAEGKAVPGCLGAPSGRRGVVLIAVLWCCAMIMWAGLQISAQTRLLGEDQLHSIIETHALYLAIGGCYEALARMVQAGPLQSEQPSDQNWQPDGNPRVVVYNTGVAVVIMESEDQKINVNTADATQLAKVLETAGADEQTSRIVAGRIGEFVNSQNSSHLQGQANTDLGRGLKHDSGFGGPLTSLDQLLLVPGVGQQLFYRYQQGTDHIAIPAGNSLFGQLTTQSGNANQQQGLQNLQGGQGASLAQNSWTAGGTYRILSFGKSAMGLPSVGVWLTVRLQGGGDAPYQILSRKVL